MLWYIYIFLDVDFSLHNLFPLFVCGKIRNKIGVAGSPGNIRKLEVEG